MPDSPCDELLYRCSCCGQKKSAQAFHRRVSSPHGLQYYCKECTTSRRLQRKRLRWHKSAADLAAQNQRDWERQRAGRLSRQWARAALMLDLCAKDYKVTRQALCGPRRMGGAYEAQAITTRLIRSVCFVHPEALAEFLGCPVWEIAVRYRDVARWSHPSQGDIRVVDRMRRIRAAYRRQEPHLKIPLKPYHEYTEAQRKPGTAHRHSVPQDYSKEA